MQLRVRRFFEEMQKTGVFGWEICWPSGSKSTLLRWIINDFWNKWWDFGGGSMAISWSCTLGLFFRMVDWPTTPEWSCNPRSHISRFPSSSVARISDMAVASQMLETPPKDGFLLGSTTKNPWKNDQVLGVFWWSALYIILDGWFLIRSKTLQSMLQTYRQQPQGLWSEVHQHLCFFNFPTNHVKRKVLENNTWFLYTTKKAGQKRDGAFFSMIPRFSLVKVLG